MRKMRLLIRVENKEDYQQITQLHRAAFKGNTEANLVEKLRDTPEYIPKLSLVVEWKKRIIEHALFYPIKINTGRKKCDSLALAPISVLPEFQRRGVGSRLLKKGLEEAQKLGFKSVIVVGHLEYYPRFGFEKASKSGIVAPFAVPNNAFFALELEKNGLKNCRGTVEYPNEYAEV